MKIKKIKFGTDGWRAIIGKEYTTDNVARVSIAVADFLHQKYDNPTVVIGHDCRFAGELFAENSVHTRGANRTVDILEALELRLRAVPRHPLLLEPTHSLRPSLFSSHDRLVPQVPFT